MDKLKIANLWDEVRLLEMNLREILNSLGVTEDYLINNLGHFDEQVQNQVLDILRQRVKILRDIYEKEKKEFLDKKVVNLNFYKNHYSIKTKKLAKFV